MPGSPSRHPWGGEIRRDAGTYKLGTSVPRGLWSGPGPVRGQIRAQPL